MKAIMLMTGSGPLTVLTSYPSPTDPRLLAKLRAKGIEKFIAYEVPLELAQERYGGHFTIVTQDLKETDDLRVLDYDGQRAYRLFRFAELGPAVMHEPASLGGTPPRDVEVAMPGCGPSLTGGGAGLRAAPPSRNWHRAPAATFAKLTEGNSDDGT